MRVAISISNIGLISSEISKEDGEKAEKAKEKAKKEEKERLEKAAKEQKEKEDKERKERFKNCTQRQKEMKRTKDLEVARKKRVEDAMAIEERQQLEAYYRRRSCPRL
jgi:predicted phage gp36 major capsid-like protein